MIQSAALDAVEQRPRAQAAGPGQADDPVVSLLRSLGDEEILYCPNPGNAGDIFITSASYQALARAGCNYRVIDTACPPQETRGRVVVYGGGGAIVPLYGAARRFLLAHHEGVRLLIVLPHTIRGNEDLLAALGRNVHLFCREWPTLEHVQRHATHAHVHDADDMAIGFDCDAALDEAQALFWPGVSSPRMAWRNVKRGLRCLPAVVRSGASRELLSLRTDTEKTDVRLPPGNVDLSNVFNVRPLDRLTCLEATYRMMRFIDRFDTVTTNRLHVCIMSALLGKQVNFLPNSYGKNRAVYDYSMAQRFPKVSWQETMPA